MRRSQICGEAWNHYMRHIKSALQTLLGTPVVQKMLDRKLMGTTDKAEACPAPGGAGGKISQKNVIFHPMDSGPRQNFEHAFTHDLVFSDLANTAEANRSPGVKIILLGVWRQCRQIPGTWLDKAAKLAPALTVKHERWQHVATHGETRGWQRHFRKRKQ
ncbi:unnamed protein product [Symbiodinium microadriaticum]|nr:unnamed protein product [Symbiodinium microadriaticum]